MKPYRSTEQQTVRLVAPSRLHFGLLPDSGENKTRRGGIGVMVDDPCLQISAHQSSEWKIVGLSSERIERIVKALWTESERLNSPLHIYVEKAPPAHAGFGSGTQLSMAIASLLSQFRDNGYSNSMHIAHKLGRGSRSLVGSKGFKSGGLIIDRGTGDESELLKYAASEAYPIPDSWRWLTVSCETEQGKSGDEERHAFARSVPDLKVRLELLACIDSELLPSLTSLDFNRFSHALGDYCHRCGQTFAAQQGGLYGSSFAEEVADHLSRAGIRGIGQSSWGPTIFALFPNRVSATSFVETNRWLYNPGIRFRISSSNNTGAIISSDSVSTLKTESH